MARRTVGRAMLRAIEYVTHNQGCYMIDAARAASPLPSGMESRNWAFGYNPVHRAIRAGYLTRLPAIDRVGAFVLYLSGSPQLTADIERRDLEMVSQ